MPARAELLFGRVVGSTISGTTDIPYANLQGQEIQVTADLAVRIDKDPILSMFVQRVAQIAYQAQALTEKTIPITGRLRFHSIPLYTHYHPTEERSPQLEGGIGIEVDTEAGEEDNRQLAIRFGELMYRFGQSLPYAQKRLLAGTIGYRIMHREEADSRNLTETGEKVYFQSYHLQGEDLARMALEEAIEDPTSETLLLAMDDTSTDPHSYHNGRDYNVAEPMHGIKLGYGALDPEQKLEFARRLGQALDTEPEERLNIDDRVETIIESLLLAARMVANPAVLAEPLSRMSARRSFELSDDVNGQSFRSLLAGAITHNQIDSRYKGIWLAMIKAGSAASTYFQGDEEYGVELTGFEGIVLMPESPESIGRPNIPAIQEALRELASRIEGNTEASCLEPVEWFRHLYYLLRIYPDQPDWRRVIFAQETGPLSNKLQLMAIRFFNGWYEHRELYPEAEDLLREMEQSVSS